MKCPHCLDSIHDQWEWVSLGNDKDGGWAVGRALCPGCSRFIINITHVPANYAAGHSLGSGIGSAGSQVYPEGTGRAPLPAEVTGAIAADYQEACNVLTKSSKASAALSRRCLQNLLREKANVKPSDLYAEIEEVIKSEKVPSHLSEMLHAVRAIGNFAAHPLKSTNTGEVIDVEPNEAEWNLDTLEALFDFYFVQPARAAVKKAALNQKLTEAGKPPLK